MKSNLFIIIFFAALSALISCKKDFLDVPLDTNTIFRQDYVKDLNTTGYYLNGVYMVLCQKVINGYSIIYGDLIADNVKPSSGVLVSQYQWSQVVDREQSASGVNDESLNMNSLWLSGYSMIRSCGFVIENAEKYQAEDSRKANDFKGQAYALRAMVHLELLKVFAQNYTYTAGATHLGIPYAASSDWTQKLERLSVAESYQKIIQDLNQAVALLGSNHDGTERHRMTELAAKALLARAYLGMEDFPNANRYAKEVLTEIPLMSASDYPSKLYTGGEAEAIFQLSPSSSRTLGAGNYNTRFAGAFYDPAANFEFTATNDIGTLLNEDPLDKRALWLKNEDQTWVVTKFPKDIIPGFSVASFSYYQTLIRSSEMCLIIAESSARLNLADDARTYLDMIRMRANPAAAPTTLSGNELLEAIYKERRKELCFENFRMWDLQRWHKPVQRADAKFAESSLLPYPSNKAVAPLPLLEVSVGGITPNPGY